MPETRRIPLDPAGRVGHSAIGFRDEGRSDIEANKELGLGICDGEFANVLLDECLESLPK